VLQAFSDVQRVLGLGYGQLQGVPALSHENRYGGTSTTHFQDITVSYLVLLLVLSSWVAPPDACRFNLDPKAFDC
jgi:hypothetical protein